MLPRVGFGYDVHRLAEDRRLIICGVEIPHSRGLLGHSDADVAIHALVDALLGSAGAGDIGTLFPDTDAQFKDIDSRILLRRAMERVREMGFSFGNADITIVAQEPKMKPYIPQMRVNLASDLDCDIADISVKATTEEHLGFTGRREGIAAYAVTLIFKTPSDKQ